MTWFGKAEKIWLYFYFLNGVKLLFYHFQFSNEFSVIINRDGILPDWIQKSYEWTGVGHGVLRIDKNKSTAVYLSSMNYRSICLGIGGWKIVDQILKIQYMKYFL